MIRANKLGLELGPVLSLGLGVRIKVEVRVKIGVRFRANEPQGWDKAIMGFSEEVL